MHLEVTCDRSAAILKNCGDRQYITGLAVRMAAWRTSELIMTDSCLPRRPCLRYGTGCCLESVRTLKKEGTATMMATTTAIAMEMALPKLQRT